MNPLEYFQVIKMSAEALKSAVEFNNQVEINLKYSEFLGKINELNSIVLDLYQEKSKLIQEKTDLEKKIMDFEQWENEKSKYCLYELDTEVFVYSYQKNENNVEPMHYLCANCMNNRKKSILELNSEWEDGSKHYYCKSCKTCVDTHAKTKRNNEQYRKNSWMG